MAAVGETLGNPRKTQRTIHILLLHRCICILSDKTHLAQDTVQLRALLNMATKLRLLQTAHENTEFHFLYIFRLRWVATVPS
jgi:hypothetical protein